MKVNYKSTLNPIISETKVIPTSVRDSLFFVYKEDGWVDFETTVLTDIDVAPIVEVVKDTDKACVLSTNTSNIIGSDKILEDTVYFYKVYVLGVCDGLRDILLNASLGIVIINGEYYTNTVINNYEIVDNVFVYSKPVVDSTSLSLEVKQNKLLVTYLKQNKSTYYFKSKYKTILQPNFISDTRFHLDTFMVHKNRKPYIALEGDIKYIDKQELVQSQGNMYNCKDLIWNYKESDETLSTGVYNTIYMDKFDFEVKEVVMHYTAKISNQVLDIKNELYLSIGDFGLELVDKDSADFVVKRVIDFNKIHVTLNNNLNKIKNILPNHEHVFTYQDFDNNSKVGLKEYLGVHTKHPSQSYYLFDKKPIYQNTNSLNTEGIKILPLGISKSYNNSTHTEKYVNIKGVNYYG